jgi:hypothetical protein
MGLGPPHIILVIAKIFSGWLVEVKTLAQQVGDASLIFLFYILMFSSRMMSLALYLKRSQC